MTIPTEREADILRLYHAEKWRVGTIATQLGLHHVTVLRVLHQASDLAATLTARPSIVDPYLPFIVETLEKYPRLPASRLFQMVKVRGYPGGPDHFRAIVARHRPRRPAEAFLRLRTLPGEQAQVDWAHFGKITIGRAVRRLLAFVMVLSWSRMIFLRFYLDARMPSFLRGHVDAFTELGGVARRLLYDNLKSAVLERKGDAIRFNPTLLELAKHYRFEPLPVAQYRGNEKGRVERAIRYVRTSFFPARSFDDLDDLNAQAHQWCTGLAADRRWPEDHSRTVRDVFEEERGRLIALPDDHFPTTEIVEVQVGKTPYVRFDLNDYSVPHTSVQTTLTVVADLDRVRVVDGAETLATHPRSFDRGRQIEQPEHVAKLVEQKRHARAHRTMDRLHQALPALADFMKRVAERGGNLGATTVGIEKLRQRYGIEALDRALVEALARSAPHLGAVRQILEQHRRAEGKPPPVATGLPDDPRLNHAVRPHKLDGYDQLREDDDDDDSAPTS